MIGSTCISKQFFSKMKYELEVPNRLIDDLEDTLRVDAALRAGLGRHAGSADAVPIV